MPPRDSSSETAPGACDTSSLTPNRGSSSQSYRASPAALPASTTGDDVRAVQQALSDAGHPTAVDGDHGPKTRDAVTAFQRANNLTVDGIVGPATRAALDL